MGKRKDKPRWKDLSFDERALKIAKRKGCSEFTLNFLKERIAKNKIRIHNIIVSPYFYKLDYLI